MKKVLFTLALAVVSLAANGVTVTDKVEDAIADAIRRLPDVAKTAIEEAKVLEDSSNTTITLYSDTTNAELADDTTMASSTTPTTYKYSYNDSEDESWEYIFAIVALICVILIPVVCIFALPLLIIWLIVRNRRKSERERNALIMAMSKEGRDVTPLVNSIKSEERPHASTNEYLYHKGIKNVCVGVGVGVLLWMIMGKLGMAIGFVIVCVGVSQLLSSKRHAASEAASAEPETATSTDSYNKEEHTQETETAVSEERE